jgi:hypothetical protein
MRNLGSRATISLRALGAKQEIVVKPISILAADFKQHGRHM